MSNIQRLRTAAFMGKTDEALRILRNKTDVPREIDTIIMGQTCLQVAAEQGLPDVVKVILACGADAEKFSDSGLTALHYAAQKGQLQCVQILVKHGVDTSLTDKKNKTAYNYAVDRHHENIANYLARNSGPTLPPGTATQGMPGTGGGYPQAGGYPQPTGGYPQALQVGGYPQPAGGYPQAGGYSQPTGTYPQPGGVGIQLPNNHCPQQTGGYPIPGNGYPHQLPAGGCPSPGRLSPSMAHRTNQNKGSASPNNRRRPRSPQTAVFADEFGELQEGIGHLGFGAPNPGAAFAETFVSGIFRNAGMNITITEPEKEPLDEEKLKMAIRDIEDSISRLESVVNGDVPPPWAKQQLKDSKQKLARIIQKE